MVLPVFRNVRLVLPCASCLPADKALLDVRRSFIYTGERALSNVRYSRSENYGSAAWYVGSADGESALQTLQRSELEERNLSQDACRAAHPR